MKDIVELAREIRIRSLKMVHRARASHIGGALSAADILAVLYGRILRHDPANPGWPARDRFLLSKGHTCVALYSTLSIKGYFPEDLLESYGEDGSVLLSHASHLVPGVELSTGSLGHALPVACGIALAARRKNENFKVYVLVSDGELDEGSNWEAILFAGHHRLDNLVLIVDYNKIQSLGNVREVLDLDPLDQKFVAFNWNCRIVDGHDVVALDRALACSEGESRPHAIIAHTIKGKGVGFMENSLLWHYRSPSGEELALGLDQIRKG